MTYAHDTVDALVAAATIRKLRIENEILEERLAAMKKAFLGGGIARMPSEWGLTGREQGLLTLLLARGTVSKSQIMNGLYGDSSKEEPDPSVINVLIYSLRKKMKPFGLVIGNIWGKGYCIDEPYRSDFLKRIDALGDFGERPRQAPRSA